MSKTPAGETQSSGDGVRGKDVTESKDLAKLVQLIGQIEDKRQGEKGPVSEAPGPANFRFVAAWGSGKIVKIVGPNPEPSEPSPQPLIDLCFVNPLAKAQKSLADRSA